LLRYEKTVEGHADLKTNIVESKIVFEVRLKLSNTNAWKLHIQVYRQSYML